MPELLTKETFLAKVFNYEENKEWKFEGDKPAIIDFYADWCGPCKMVAPIMEELAREYDGKIDVYKINTEEAARTGGSLWHPEHPQYPLYPGWRTAPDGSRSTTQRNLQKSHHRRF